MDPRPEQPVVPVVSGEVVPGAEVDLWSGAYASAEEQLRRIWARLREDWIRQKANRSRSPHTERMYRRHTDDWLDFLATVVEGGRVVQPWEATSHHVRLWIEYLEARGLSDATINAKLAACSSWYSFVINEKRLVNGVEVSVFFDANGNTRANPFRTGNVERKRVRPYGRAMPLSAQDVGRLMAYLERQKGSVRGARNRALILTFLLTGWRNEEVASMTWGRIRESRTQPGHYVYLWRGKGGKVQPSPLPLRVYHAIVHYLKLDGRWAPGTEWHIQPEDYIWRPLQERGMANLANVDPERLDPERHISGKSVLSAVRSTLRRAGVSGWQTVRVHDLRHTFAHMFYQRRGDLERLRDLLHHESLATTGIYVREVLEDPVDDYSEDLYQGYLLTA